MAPRPGRRGRRPRAGAWRPVGQSARWGGGRGRKVGGLHVLGSGEGSLPSPGPATGLGLTRPRGPSGLAWPPGLQCWAQEVGVERAGLRGGDRELWEQRQLSQSGKRNRLGGPDAGREGAAGKAREGSRAGIGPPPFFGSLARRGGLQGQARWETGSRARGTEMGLGEQGRAALEQRDGERQSHVQLGARAESGRARD